MRQPHVRQPAFSLPAACPCVCGRNPRTENFRRILLSQIAQSDYIPATCNLHRRGDTITCAFHHHRNRGHELRFRVLREEDPAAGTSRRQDRAPSPRLQEVSFPCGRITLSRPGWIRPAWPRSFSGHHGFEEGLPEMFPLPRSMKRHARCCAREIPIRAPDSISTAADGGKNPAAAPAQKSRP